MTAGFGTAGKARGVCATRRSLTAVIDGKGNSSRVDKSSFPTGYLVHIAFGALDTS